MTTVRPRLSADSPASVATLATAIAQREVLPVAGAMMTGIMSPVVAASVLLGEKMMRLLEVGKTKQSLEQLSQTKQLSTKDDDMGKGLLYASVGAGAVTAGATMLFDKMAAPLIGAYAGYKMSQNVLPEMQSGTANAIKSLLGVALGAGAGTVVGPAAMQLLGVTGDTATVLSSMALFNSALIAGYRKKASGMVVAGIDRESGLKRFGKSAMLGSYLSDFDNNLWTLSERQHMTENLYQMIKYIKFGKNEEKRKQLFNQMCIFLPIRYKDINDIDFPFHPENPTDIKRTFVEKTIQEFLSNACTDASYLQSQRGKMANYSGARHAHAIPDFKGVLKSAKRLSDSITISSDIVPSDHSYDPSLTASPKSFHKDAKVMKDWLPTDLAKKSLVEGLNANERKTMWQKIDKNTKLNAPASIKKMASLFISQNSGADAKQFLFDTQKESFLRNNFDILLNSIRISPHSNDIMNALLGATRPHAGSRGYVPDEMLLQKLNPIYVFNTILLKDPCQRPMMNYHIFSRITPTEDQIVEMFADKGPQLFQKLDGTNQPLALDDSSFTPDDATLIEQLQELDGKVLYNLLSGAQKHNTLTLWNNNYRSELLEIIGKHNKKEPIIRDDVTSEYLLLGVNDKLNKYRFTSSSQDPSNADSSAEKKKGWISWAKKAGPLGALVLSAKETFDQIPPNIRKGIVNIFRKNPQTSTILPA